MKIRVMKHEAVPGCGSYEVRFPDGRPSKYFYFENLAGRRLRPDQVEQAVAEQKRQDVRPRRAGQARFAITTPDAYLHPMLKAFDFCIPTSAKQVPSSPDWLHEI